MYLCAACDKPVTWTTEGGAARDRRRVMKGYSTEMTVTGRISFSLKPDSAVTVKLALGVGETEEAAVTAAGQTLLSRETAGSHLDRCATELDLAPKDIREAMGYMTDLLYVSDERRRLSEAVAANTERREGLWRFGISGDLPIMTMTVSGEEELKRALEVVKQHSLLSENGFSFDLVLIADDNGDYMMPRRRAITECLRRLGREHHIGARGGVHLVDGSSPHIGVIKAMSGKIEGIKEDGERGIQV
jgi:cyclic beta-1,2-glucan synthetase